MNNKLDKKSRIVSIMILLVLSCILMAVPAMAEGTGDGSGGGKNIPLGLESSIPADGAKDVSLSGDINLSFNKNVIYLLIRENNKKCISLIAADGSKVPIEVIMADDQTTEGFEKRRDISVRPLEKLQPGTAYTVKVSPDFGAKNGTTLGHEVTVSFVTEGTAVKNAPAAGESAKPLEEVKPTPAAEQNDVKDAAPANAPSAPAESGKKPVAEEQKASDTEQEPAQEEQKVSESEKNPAAEDKTKQEAEKQVKPEEKAPVKENPQDEQEMNWTYAIAAGLVLAVGVGYLQVRKRGHK